MNQEYYTLLTPAGLAAVTNAMMSQTPVDFAFIAVGDSNGTPYNPTGNETSLVNETWRAPVSNYNLDEDNPNWLNLESVIPSVTGGFTIREIGLYDTNGVLLAIGKTSELYKPVSTQGAIIDLRVVMTIEVTNADQVIINIDPSVIYASKQYVDAKHQLVVEPLNAHIPDSTAHVRYGVASGVNDKTFSISPAPHAYLDGMAISFKNTTENTAAVTLNVNGLGAKSLVKSNGAAIGAGQLKANGIYTARYNATTGNFTLQGEGGEYGDAVANDVRTGKTFGTENGLLQGGLDLSQLIPSNIREGVTIDGVLGTLTPGKRTVIVTNVESVEAVSSPYSTYVDGMQRFIGNYGNTHNYNNRGYVINQNIGFLPRYAIIVGGEAWSNLSTFASNKVMFSTTDRVILGFESTGTLPTASHILLIEG